MKFKDTHGDVYKISFAYDNPLYALTTTAKIWKLCHTVKMSGVAEYWDLLDTGTSYYRGDNSKFKKDPQRKIALAKVLRSLEFDVATRSEAWKAYFDRRGDTHAT